jgi:hypothetical protein
MLDEVTKEAVADYVLAPHEPERLKLAVTLHDAFDTIRLRVIRDFAEQVSRFLSDELPDPQGWRVEAQDLLANPQRKYTGLSVRRAAWDKGLHVGIEAQTGGPGSWIIGAWGERSYRNAVLTALLNERWGAGKTTDQWPWFHYFSDNAEFGHWEFGDWTTGTAIVAMRDGTTGDYGKRLCERIVSIAKVVDSLFQA